MERVDGQTRPFIMCFFNGFRAWT